MHWRGKHAIQKMRACVSWYFVSPGYSRTVKIQLQTECAHAWKFKKLRFYCRTEICILQLIFWLQSVDLEQCVTFAPTRSESGWLRDQPLNYADLGTTVKSEFFWIFMHARMLFVFVFSAELSTVATRSVVLQRTHRYPSCPIWCTSTVVLGS